MGASESFCCESRSCIGDNGVCCAPGNRNDALTALPIPPSTVIPTSERFDSTLAEISSNSNTAEHQHFRSFFARALASECEDGVNSRQRKLLSKLHEELSGTNAGSAASILLLETLLYLGQSLSCALVGTRKASGSVDAKGVALVFGDSGSGLQSTGLRTHVDLYSALGFNVVWCTRPWDTNLQELLLQRISTELYNQAGHLQRDMLVVHTCGNAGFCLWTELRQAWLLSHSGPRNGHTCCQHSPAYAALGQLPRVESVSLCMVHYNGPYEFEVAAEKDQQWKALVPMCTELVKSIEHEITGSSGDDETAFTKDTIKDLVAYACNHQDSVILRDFIDGPFNMSKIAMVNDSAMFKTAMVKPRLFLFPSENAGTAELIQKYISDLETRIAETEKGNRRQDDDGNMCQQSIRQFVATASEDEAELRRERQHRRNGAVTTTCAC